MRTPEITTLPTTLPQYNEVNESISRKATEQYLQDLRNDIIENRNKTNGVSSLALRRFQFLLMGASNG